MSSLFSSSWFIRQVWRSASTTISVHLTSFLIGRSTILTGKLEAIAPMEPVLLQVKCTIVLHCFILSGCLTYALSLKPLPSVLLHGLSDEYCGVRDIQGSTCATFCVRDNCNCTTYSRSDPYFPCFLFNASIKGKKKTNDLLFPAVLFPGVFIPLFPWKIESLLLLYQQNFVLEDIW